MSTQSFLEVEKFIKICKISSLHASSPASEALSKVES